MPEEINLIEMTTDLVAAYVSNNAVPVGDLPALIRQVYAALNDAAGTAKPEVGPIVPAVTIKRSITPGYLICLKDGRKFKSMKRHLRNAFDMTPDQYRAKWGLPKDYPMIAPDYSARRSALAKKMGLGQGGRKSKAAAPEAPAKASGRRKAK